MIKKALIIIFLLLALIIGAFYLLRGRVENLIRTSVESSVKDLGLNVQMENLNVHPYWVSAGPVYITSSRSPIPLGIELDLVNISLSLPSLLTLKPEIDLEMELYEGQVDAAIALQPPNATKVDFENINLAAYPLFLGMGITSGTIGGNIKAPDDSVRGDLMNLSVKIEDLSKGVETILPTSLTGRAAPLRIPKLSNGTVNLALRSTQEEIKIPVVSIVFKEISVSGEATIHQKEQTVQGDASGKLGPETKHLIDEGLIPAENFSLKVSGMLAKPRVELKGKK